MELIRNAVTAGLIVAYALVLAAEPLYSVRSKDQGAPFDLEVTEVKREPLKSHLLVPGFHRRSAPGSRWLMCVYTDLAIKRGFKYWSVVYPEEASETLVVGFFQAETDDIAKTLGNDYVASRVMPDKPASVEVFARFCGMKN